jgi:hypothetical protein
LKKCDNTTNKYHRPNHQYVKPRDIQYERPAQRKATSSGDVCSAEPLFAGNGWSLKYVPAAKWMSQSLDLINYQNKIKHNTTYAGLRSG